jgi:hypothetical protein
VASPEEVAKARNQTMKQWCGNGELKHLLLSIDKVTFRYVDDAGQTLMTYNFARGDCPER